VHFSKKKKRERGRIHCWCCCGGFVVAGIVVINLIISLLKHLFSKMENVFTPPTGQLLKCPHSLDKLTKVTAVLKKEMTFDIRAKKYDGLSIRDKDGNDVGCLSYDLLRYLNRASILQSIVARDGAESLKEGIMSQVRDTNLFEAFSRIY
jgi:hypothetical protein